MRLKSQLIWQTINYLLDYFSVRKQKVIQYLALITLLLCIIPSGLQILGVDFGINPPSLQKVNWLDGNEAQIINEIHGILAGSFVHTILEWSAFCTGVLTAILAFVHFALNRDIATPIIGLSLFYAGCMDAFHTLAADRLITAVSSPDTLIPFTWALCRLFSALILIVGVSLFLVPQRFHPQRQLSFLLSSSLVAAIFAYLTIYICVRLENLPQTLFPNALISRPWDVIPLTLFVLMG